MVKLIYLVLISLPISYLLYQSRSTQIKEILNYVGLEQMEIKLPGDLLTQDGNLNDSGWARQATKRFNPEVLPFYLRQFRLKKWDFYSIFHQEFFFSMAMADIGYAQSVQVTFFDVENQVFIHADKIIIPYLHKRLDLSNGLHLQVEPQVYTFESNDLQLSFKGLNVGGNKEQRFLNLNLTHQGHTLELNVRIDSTTTDDQMVIYQPINGKKTQFFYNVKAYNWLPKGELIFDNHKFEILQSTSNAGMDWGRGIWNYHSFYLWGTGMGFLKNGQRFAINVGGGFQDDKSSLATEESIFINKKLIKLRDLVYEYDLNDLDLPFVIRSHDVQRNQFSLKFSWEEAGEENTVKSRRPIVETETQKPQPGQFYCEFLAGHRFLKNTDLVLVTMRLEQFVGEFSGAYVSKDGSIVEFRDILGMVEFNKAKW